MAQAATELTFLDGGMGQELIRRSGKRATTFWSGRAMIDAPDLVTGLHRDFIEAGANVITLNSYSLTPAKIARYDIPYSLRELQELALSLAHKARDMTHEDVKIAGCLPPLVQSYRSELIADDQQNFDDYSEIASIQAPGTDLFICETMSAIREAVTATSAAAAFGKPVWTALTVDDSNGARLRSGEPLNEAIDASLSAGASAILINCSSPEATTTAIDLLAGYDVAFGAYANGFKSIAALSTTNTVDVLERREDLTPEAYAAFGRRWIGAGATIVGGCCEVNPEHIRELTRQCGSIAVPTPDVA